MPVVTSRTNAMPAMTDHQSSLMRFHQGADDCIKVSPFAFRGNLGRTARPVTAIAGEYEAAAGCRS